MQELKLTCVCIHFVHAWGAGVRTHALVCKQRLRQSRAACPQASTPMLVPPSPLLLSSRSCAHTLDSVLMSFACMCCMHIYLLAHPYASWLIPPPCCCIHRPGSRAAAAAAAAAGTTADWVKRGPRQNPTSSLLAVALSSDGKYLAVGGGDKGVHVFDAGSGSHVAAYPGHRDQVGGGQLRCVFPSGLRVGKQITYK